MVKQTSLDPVALVYHELRAPLGLVATAAYSALEEADNAAVRDRCEAIARSAERMLRTAAQVLAIAAADQEPPEASDFLPVDVVDAIAADLDAFDVRVELRSTPAARCTAVRGDRGRFEALVQSVLMNAIDHSDPGATIAIAAQANDDTVALTVTNPLPSRTRHRGLTMGSYICGQLAGHLGAQYDAAPDGDVFVVHIELPQRPRA